MRQVQAYQALDGSLHLYESDCKQRDKQCNIRDVADKIENTAKCASVTGNYTSIEIAEFIVNHFGDIEYLVQVRHHKV